ncbi:HTH_Tnp_Tc3_2 domain-containing protein [Trichonephila clavipes]|nr:HTH_Tnp_Tc3_2 domain-containing protein [Trichonephila clavipes]
MFIANDYFFQQLQKKRHIGNDIVCVAFLEADDTLFSPTCIKSHFLHTFIVVRTSPSAKASPTTYEVSVVSRDEVGAYKPYLWHRSKFTKELGIAQSVISRLWRRFQDDGNVSRCYSTGRTRVTMPNEDRYIFGSYCQKKQTEHNIRPVSSALFSYWYDSFKADRVQTHKAHWSLCSWPVRCVPLTATHCRLRLTWSREPALWTPQQWSCVMFSNESRFSLQSDSRRTLIWRAPGTHHHQDNTIERHHYGGAGWLV